MPMTFDGFVYNAHGEKIGVIRQLHLSVETIETTTFASTARQYTTGLKTLEFSGIVTDYQAFRDANPSMWKCAYCRCLMPHRHEGTMLTNCRNCGGGRTGHAS